MFLKNDEMRALELCNGCIDVELPLISQTERDIITKMEEDGIVTQCRLGETNMPEQEYVCYPSRYIKTAHWSVTGRCNYRCKHCCMSAPDAKYGELSHEAVLDIVKQLADCGVMRVSLTGGEALVRKDFWDIVDALSERDILITDIYSNGKLVTDDFLDELERKNINPKISMSYDGVGWHDWMRGVDGAEKAVEEAFARCRERNIATTAEMCIHRKNKDTLRESVNRLHGLGCKFMKINQVSDLGAWSENGYGKDALSYDELYRLFLDYIPQYYEDGMPLSIQLGGFFYATAREPDKYEIPVLKECDNPEKMCVCGHARHVMYISPEGRVLPCFSLSGMDVQYEFPLITEVGLAECLTDSYYMKVIDTRASELMKHNARCETCEYVKKCLCGCRAAALESYPDDIMGIDEATCRMYQGGWIERIQDTMKQLGKTMLN